MIPRHAQSTALNPGPVFLRFAPRLRCRRCNGLGVLTVGWTPSWRDHFEMCAASCAERDGTRAALVAWFLTMGDDYDRRGRRLLRGGM